MSAPPDFMTRLLAGLQAGMNNPLLMNGLGIMSAAGPSRMPVSLGQALGGGLQQGQQLQQGQLQNQMQQLMLGQNIQGLQAMQQANQGNAPIPPAFQQYAPPTTSAPMQSPATAQINQSDSTAQPASPKQNNPLLQTPNSQPQNNASLPPEVLQQIAQDTQRLRVLESMPNNPTYAKAAADLRAQMGASYFDLPDNMIPGGVVPGQHWQINELGEKIPRGEGAIKTVQVLTPSGTLATVPYDARTQKITDVGGVMNQVDYTQPLKDNAQEKMAQRVAAGLIPMPTPSSRFPGAINIGNRAQFLNPQLTEATYPTMAKAAEYWTSGEGGKQTTAFNAAISHLKTLEPIIDNLNNTNTPAFNHLKNWFAGQTGSTAPTSFATAKQYIAGELAKVVAGGGVTEGDRQTAESSLNAAQTPAQLKQSVEVIKNLMGGKLTALKTQYGSSGLKNFNVLLEPASQEALSKFESSQTAQPQAPKAVNWSDLK